MSESAPFRWIRAVTVFACIAVAGYFIVTGFMLQRFASGLLTVGPLAAALDAGPRPTDPLALGYRGDPATAFRMAFDDVMLQTDLGPAPAWFVPGAPGAAPAAPGLGAIYVHGIAGAREDGYRHLNLLHPAGIDTLLITYRNDPGAPASPDGTYGFGLTEWRDLDVAVNYMQGRGYTDLIVVAESMGGAILGQFLLQSPQADAVTAVALDSPGLSFRGVLRHLAAQQGLPFPGGIAWVAQTMLGLRDMPNLRAAEVTDVFAGFPGPLFIAHGSGDRVVPQAGSDRLISLRVGPTVAVRTDADHLQSWFADPDRYRLEFDGLLTLTTP